MIELIKQNYEYILAFFSTVLAYVGGRKMKSISEKQADADASTASATALVTMQSSYDSFVSDFKERYVELKEMQTELKAELKEARSETVSLRLEMKSLHFENAALKKDVSEWEQKYLKLRKDFELYKKNNQ